MKAPDQKREEGQAHQHAAYRNRRSPAEIRLPSPARPCSVALASVLTRSAALCKGQVGKGQVGKGSGDMRDPRIW